VVSYVRQTAELENAFRYKGLKLTSLHVCKYGDCWLAVRENNLKTLFKYDKLSRKSIIKTIQSRILYLYMIYSYRNNTKLLSFQLLK
jgi:hypothetical protein